jgi:hypothetical protein
VVGDALGVPTDPAEQRGGEAATTDAGMPDWVNVLLNQGEPVGAHRV